MDYWRRVAGRGGRGLAGLAVALVCAAASACVYSWPTSLLNDDDGSQRCGNGRLDLGEVCDGTQLGGETCGTQGFWGGNLSCTEGCTLETSGCLIEGVCGDGWVGGNEGCDDGGTGGGDGCSALCQVEPGWACEGEPSQCSSGCGNGVCHAPAGEGSASCPEDCGWIRLAAGQSHTCGVKGDGSVWCWGDNALGQLGGGDGLDQASPMRVVGLPVAEKVSAGSGHTCAIGRDGSVWCWGDNAEGQLGDGSIVARLEPVHVWQLPEVISLSAGAAHTCVVTTAFEAFCWGRNSEGQLGNGEVLDRQLPTAVAIGAGLTGARAVACGSWHSCAVHEDETLWCWGKNNSGQLGIGNTEDSLLPRAVSTEGGLSGATSLSAGVEHTCAVDLLGVLWCWGNGGQRRLGDGGLQNRPSPVLVMTLGTALDVAAGGSHTCAVDTDGNLFCWGAGAEGQLGTLSMPPQSNPVPVVELLGGAQVVAGALHSCALLEDAGAWCWGAGIEGQLGQGLATSSATAVPVLDPF